MPPTVRDHAVAAADAMLSSLSGHAARLGAIPTAFLPANARNRLDNDWLHLEKQPTAEDAESAIRLAGRLFELLEGVPLNVMGDDAEGPTNTARGAG
jgi:hypothetical protein